MSSFTTIPPDISPPLPRMSAWLPSMETRAWAFTSSTTKRTTIYVVVEAFKRQQRQPLDLNQLAAQVSAKGRVAQRLTGFESRPEQQRMLRAVATAFNESKAALIEAGTGTGKSLAYLLPAIHWAVQNKQRVVVSTNTINLQEQLMHKDLPLLQQALDLKFKAVSGQREARTMSA